MKQYEFKLTADKGYYRVASVRCTARDVQTALKAVENYYGKDFTVHAEPIAIRPAHEVLGEIDATNAD